MNYAAININAMQCIDLQFFSVGTQSAITGDIIELPKGENLWVENIEVSLWSLNYIASNVSSFTVFFFVC